MALSVGRTAHGTGRTGAAGFFSSMRGRLRQL